MKVNRSDLWNKAKSTGKELVDNLSDKARELAFPPRNLEEVKEKLIRKSALSAPEILGRLKTVHPTTDFTEYQRGYEFAKKATQYPKEYVQTQILSAKATNNQSFLKGFKEAQKAADFIAPLKKK